MRTILEQPTHDIRSIGNQSLCQSGIGIGAAARRYGSMQMKLSYFKTIGKNRERLLRREWFRRQDELKTSLEVW